MRISDWSSDVCSSELDHGQHFATNFNPEINIREVTAVARRWENGDWVESPPLSHKQTFDFDQVGPKNMYLMYHEELESLKTHLPEIRRIRFWMTFGDAYLKHLEVLHKDRKSKRQNSSH